MDFYFDENMPVRVANALNELEAGEIHNVYHIQSVWEKGIKDPDLFPLIKEKSGIFVTNDLKILSRKNEYELLQSLEITAIFIDFPSGTNFVYKYQKIFKHWEDIKEICTREKHPFLCKFKMRGNPEFLK